MSQQNLKLFTRINSYIILSKLIKPSMSTLDSGIGSLDMSPACSDEEAVRRLFVFLKDNLIFESLQDGLMQKKLLNEREKEDYVCSNCARHYWSERLIKLIIRKKKCKEFVAFMHQMSCHKHVSEKILEVQKKATEETQKAANGAVQRRLNLTLTHELLQRHFACLYMELEPREIMDEMFQAGHLTVFEHDNVTEFNQRHKRLSCLLVILRKKNLYAQLVCTLQSLGYMSVLDTLQKDRKLKNKPSEYSTCIQHNFILLQEDIPGSGDARLFMEHELDQTNISDIESCKGAVRKISKLLKILLIRGKSACKEFFRVVEVDLKMEVLIQKMKYKSAEIKRRGRPNLNQRHRSLKTSCLQEHEEFLNEELEPLDICDLLFEERAMEISAHDKITETSKRQKQMKYLLATVNENENDCFYFFLYILQKEGYESILEELKKSTPGAVGAVPHEQSENLRLSLRVEKEPDDVGNEDIQMRLSVGGHNGQQVEQALQDSHSSGTGILEEAILHGAVDIWGVSSGSIVLQLRPVTDQAVQTLLNVRDNNRLVEMIVGMLKKVNIASMMDGTEPLEIKVQVYKANPVGAISKMEDAELIKKRLKAHRNVLVSELEPRAIAHVLSKSKAFPKSAIDSVLNADSYYGKVKTLLSLVEDGNSEVVKEFVTALKDLGYSSIVELIDPPDIHNRSENIRKITSNYKNILEEMQMKLAKETLSKCVGDIDEIREKILPKNGNRKKRMSSFLQFILQDEYNVIEFKKMLRKNDLEDLLKIDENVQGEHIPTQGIEKTFVEDRIHSSSDGVLFEAFVTLSHTELSKQLEDTSIEDSGQLQSDTEILRKTINFFKKTLQTSKKEVRPLEVAKECVGPNAKRSCINRYLHCLERAKVLSLTYLKITKDSKSDPRWSALPDIKDITEERIKELVTKLNSSSKEDMKSENKRLDQPTVTYNVFPSKNESAASNIAETEDTRRSVPSMHAPAYPFSKGTHNQKDVLSSIARAEVSKSVGLIHIDGQPMGTGFRVGEKYLVTCGHVIQKVIKVKPHMLDGQRLTIEFYRITYNQKENELLIFGFQPLIAYFDEEYDFVVLELRSHDAGVPFPPALNFFADVFDSEIHLVGHPGGRQMKEDSIVPRWSPDHDEEIIPYINYLAHWSRSHFPDKRDYYSILLEPPRKIIFHTTFDTGSSGSPGVMIRNNRPCVVVLVRGGTPSCFYENLYPYSPVEDDHKVEYGYAMSDIHLKMLKSTKQNIKDLASEIFREWI